MKSAPLLHLVCLSLLVALAIALPRPSADDADSSTTQISANMTDNYSQNATDSGDNAGDDYDDDDDNDNQDNSEVIAFNIGLFPAASVFGPATFQKLQESLLVIRDQLNSMWNMTVDTKSGGFMQIPDDYNNSTTQTKIASQVVNGTLVTVNETIHKTNTNGVQSFYRIRVISLRPENGTDSVLQMSQQKAATDSGAATTTPLAITTPTGAPMTTPTGAPMTMPTEAPMTTPTSAPMTTAPTM